MINWVAHASILRDGSIGKINFAIFIHYHIFKNCAGLNCVKNIWLLLFRKVNDLCITAALKIENCIFGGPTVFVVTNQFTIWIGRKCCFSSSGKSEKYCSFTILANIGGAVHWHCIFIDRQNKIERRENSFFNFPSITCSTN